MSNVGDQIRMDWLLDSLKGKDISNCTIIFGTCNDCKYYFDVSKDNNIGNLYKNSYCRKHGKNVYREDFYCADFEKREDEMAESEKREVKTKDIAMDKEITRTDRIYCLKVSSDYHPEVCEECRYYPNCDHMTQDDMTEVTIRDLEMLEKIKRILEEMDPLNTIIRIKELLDKE